MPPLLAVFLAADAQKTRSAKVSPLTMDDEHLMHVLVQGFANSSMFRTPRGDFRKLKKWPGVVLDPDRRVSEIKWERDFDEIDFAGGSISLSWLPMRLQSIRIRNQMLEGTLDMAALPPALKTLFVSYNCLTGTVDLRAIPRTLQTIYLSYNNITGPLDLSYLPPGLEKLGLACNEIEQDEVVVGAFPASLQWMSLSNNRIGRLVDASGSEIKDDRIEFEQVRF